MQLAAGPERGCVEDQPQQLRQAGRLELIVASAHFHLLRLVLCTQPRSGRCVPFTAGAWRRLPIEMPMSHGTPIERSVSVALAF
jgi:hypothetical protein